MLTGMSLLTF